MAGANEIMKAVFELTPDDLVALTVGHTSRSPTIRRQRYGCLIAAVVLLSALPGLILLTTDDPLLKTAKDIWPLLLGPVLFVLFVIPYMRWRAAAITRRMLAEGQNSGYYGPCSLSIEPDGLRETKSTGESVRTWSAVEKVLVTDTHAFIYTSAVEAFVLPRRAFHSADAFQEFVNEVSERGGVDQKRI